MTFRRIISTKSVTIYVLFSFNKKCIHKVVFQCSKCSRLRQIKIGRSSCLQKNAKYNKNKGSATYEIEDKKLKCGLYEVAITSYDGHNMAYEKVVTKPLIESCSDIHNFRMWSIQRDCSAAIIRFSFIPPVSNSNRRILKYRITVKLKNSGKCVLTTTLTCKDCSKKTQLLPDIDSKLSSCFKLKNEMTFNKDNKFINFQINDPRITMATSYLVIIESATICSNCPHSHKSLTTISKHACSPIRDLRVSKIQHDCSSAKIKISFSPPVSNSNDPILKYRIIIRTKNGGSCILTTTFNCRDCNDETSLLPDTDGTLRGCYRLRNKFMYNKNQNLISFEIYDYRITLSTSYIVTIQPATKCIRCSSSNKSVFTLSSQGCSGIRNLQLSSTQKDCSSAKIGISFAPPISNSKHPILKYRITIKSSTGNSCILTTTLNCRDCNDQTTLLRDSDASVKGCSKLQSTNTYTKDQSLISFEINNPRITLGKGYSIIIEPATKCSKCPKSNKSLTTISSQTQCSGIRNFQIASIQHSCLTARIRIRFNPPISNSKNLILKYRITILSRNRDSCILTLTLNCRDCANKTTLLPDTDTKLRSCFKLIHTATFSKYQTVLSIQIYHPRIMMGSGYVVIIEPATQCSKCTKTNLYVKTVARKSCSDIQAIGVQSKFLNCNNPKLLISFRRSVAKRIENVLRYIITVRFLFGSSCIFVINMDCRDCKLLSKLSRPLNSYGCKHMANHLTFSKYQSIVSLYVTSPHIGYNGYYQVVIEPVTLCSKCTQVKATIKTIPKSNFATRCQSCTRKCMRVCKQIPYQKTIQRCNPNCHTYNQTFYKTQCEIICRNECRMT